MSSSASALAIKIDPRVPVRQSRPTRLRSLRSLRASLALPLLLAGCASKIDWRGTAIAPDGNSQRESSIVGALERGRYFEKARIVLDRSFETTGFRGAPFMIEPGAEHALVFESPLASLAITVDPNDPSAFVPHFFVDLEVPGVSRPARYTLVCIGGTGRLDFSRDGDEVRGELALTVACRTYVDGAERDESEIHLGGDFRAAVE
jgi:hypothetical protein